MQKLDLNGESIDRRGMVGIPVSQQFYVTLKFHQVSPDTNGRKHTKTILGDLMLIPWNPAAVFSLIALSWFVWKFLLPHKNACLMEEKHDKPLVLGVPNAQHCSAASFMSFWTPFKRMEPGCWSQSSMVVTNDLLVIVQKNIKQHTELYIYPGACLVTLTVTTIHTRKKQNKNQVVAPNMIFISPY